MKKKVKDTNHSSSINNISKQLQESEVFYKHLAELSPEAVVVHCEGKIVYANQATLRLIEAESIHEVIGQPVIRFIHPDSLPLIQSRIKTMLSKNKVAPPVEEKFISIKGNIVIAETKAVPFTFQNKPAILAILTDITERKKIQERQAFLEKISTLLGASIDYKTTLHNISKLLVPHFADYIRIVLMTNEGTKEEVAAYHSDPKKSGLVKKLYKTYKTRTDATSGIDHLLQRGKPEIMESIPRLSNQEFKNNAEIQSIITELGLTSYMGVPLKLNGKVIGAITFSSTRKDRLYAKADLQFAEEIARRIVYAIENARLYTNAQNAINLRDEFISLASHELKTPLTSLKIYAQSFNHILEQHGQTKLRTYSHKMDQQINKLTLLVNDLLDVSKISHGKLEFIFEAVDLNTIVNDTVTEIQEITKKHELIVEGRIQEKVYADPYRIHQVLTNLLTNAIKYSPKAEKVLITLTPEKTAAVVSVQDFGIGIAPVHQKKIFTQFYRVSAPEEKTFPGLGMGLFISEEIIKRHGGGMNVVSSKGHGSKFSFTLPYKMQSTKHP